jgi:hypothetical protein
VKRLQETVAAFWASREAAREEMRTLREQVAALQAQINGTSQVAAGPRTGKQTAASRMSLSGRHPREERLGTDKQRARHHLQAERELLQQRGSILLPAGQLVIEPGVQYTRSSRDRLEVLGFSFLPAIIVGKLEVAEINRDTYMPLVVARYGINDWMEFEVNVPYVFRSERMVEGPQGVESTHRVRDNGIGDITAGLFTHILRESDLAWMPDTVLSVRGKFPTGRDPFGLRTDREGNPTELATGSGFWGFSSGFSMVKTLDPAVLFLSGSYYWNIEEDVGHGIGKIDPGDTFEYNMGLAFALNERLALSFSHQHRITNRSKVEGSSLERSDGNASSLFVGGNWVLSNYTSINFSLGIGVTEDAPDLTVEMRVPFRLPYKFPTLGDLASISFPWFGSDTKQTTVLLQ